MANTLKIKRGTNATIPQGQLAEPLFTTDTYDLYIGKGSGGNQRFQKYIASGTSSQFLKGDGSLDSNTYQTALTFSSPLVNTSGTISIPAATGSVNGYLSSTDWTTFNSKEPAITAGTTSQYYRGDKTFQTLDTAAVPENGAIYFTEPRVRATVLTGLNLSGGGTIAATDSVLTAFGKVQNQISALVGGATYQGTWNASTNTPTLASGTGTKGYYYVVSVAGSTNLDGITDWKIGDWAIFNGTTWDKVDNTDAVSSVNGFTGAVNLALDNISDVSAASPTNAQLLRFNGTSSLWENWTPTFEPALTKGNLTEATSSVLTITGGTGAVIGSGTTIQVASAGAAQNGVVTTGTQTFAGVKTFSSTPVVPALHLADMTAGSGALYYNTSAKRLTLANYNADGILMFEVNGGNYAMSLNADLTMRLWGYTTNGFVKFSNSDGTLAVDTNTYLTSNQTITLSGDVTGSGATSIATTIANNAVTTSKINAGAITAAKLAEFGAGDSIKWAANTDTAYIKFVSSGDAAGESYLEIATGDNSDEPIKFLQSSNIRVQIDTDGKLKNGAGTEYITNSGTWAINTTGSAATLTTARNFTINGTAKSFDGSANVSWTAAEIGLTSYLPLTGGTLTGALSGTSATFSSTILANDSIRALQTTTSGSIQIITDADNGTSLRAALITFGSTATDSLLGIARASNSMLYKDGGKLAIGTRASHDLVLSTNDTARLTISSTGAATFSSSVTASVASGNGAFYINNASLTNKNWTFLPNTNGTESDLLLYYTGTGAGTKLTIASTGAATFSSSVTASGAKSQLIVSGDSGSGAGISLNTALSGTNRRNWFIGTEENVEGDFVIKCSTAAGGNANAGNTRLSILNNGNVGIGTTSPSAALQIQVDSNFTGGVNYTTPHLFIRSGASAASGNVTRLAMGVFDGAQVYLDTICTSTGGGAADLAISTRNVGAPTEKMRITSGGNVGVNCTGSNAKLEVVATTGEVFRADAASGAYRIIANQTNVLLSSEVLIGTTTDSGAYALQVNGSVYATAYYESSDIRLKDVLTNSYSENFSAIEFMWKDKRDDKKHWGYAAQDVMKYIPDAIEVNNDGMMTVNYNEAHTWKIAQLEAKIIELEAKIK